MVSEYDVFLRNQRQLLLRHLFLPWKRRGAALLQVGLKSGLPPDFFWEAGFEVDALDDDAALLDNVRAQSSPKVDFHLGQMDHYPFDDGAFDYVVLAHVGITGFSRRELLAEGLRVASRGIIILEWNRFSLGAMKVSQAGARVWPWSLALLSRQECPDCRIGMMSILPFPPVTWPNGSALSEDEDSMPRPSRRRGAFSRIHNLILPLPVGAVLGVRIELDTRALTPLGAVTESLRASSYADGGVAGAGRSARTSTKREDQAT